MRDEKVSRADWIQSVLTEHERPLIRYALHLTGSVEMARDVVQETFLRLCSQEPNKLKDRIAPWLFAVCRTRALDAIRQTRRLEISSVGQDRNENSQTARELGPSDLFERSEFLNQILKLLAKLTASQQEVIRLRFEGDFSYKEISLITGLSVTNVGFLLHEGLKTIRHQMRPTENARTLRRIK